MKSPKTSLQLSLKFNPAIVLRELENQEIISQIGFQKDYYMLLFVILAFLVPIYFILLIKT